MNKPDTGSGPEISYFQPSGRKQSCAFDYDVRGVLVFRLLNFGRVHCQKLHRTVPHGSIMGFLVFGPMMDVKI
jgi:hypothetical protein